MTIAETLAALYTDSPVLEIRILHKTGQVDSGYFNDYARLEKAVSTYNGESAIYFTLNPCKAELIARINNRIDTRVKKTTTDREIETRRYIIFDFDPVRADDIPATDDEHKRALTAAARTRDYFTENGWPQPIEIDSGNGAYLLYAIDFPNDEESRKLVTDCLTAANLLFGDDCVKIDTKMANAARIIRLPETKNIKGDSSNDRPHRYARVIAIPHAIHTVHKLLLQKLADLVPQEPKPTSIIPKFDFDKWLDDNQIEIVKKERWNTAIMYTLARCAFNPAHKDAAIFRYDNGGYQYKCFHNSCDKNNWRAFTKLYPLPDSGKSKSAKIMAKLFDLGYTFRMNECGDRIEVNGVPITNGLAAKVRVQMTDLNFKSVREIEDAYHANALDNSYHPVKDYLNKLSYDTNRDYIRELADHFKDIHPSINGESVFYTWFKRWLIGAVAKVFGDHQNPMLVLDGPQDIGKSYFAQYLASGLPHFFLESAIDPESNDHKLRLIRSWIWEVGELGATTRKADVEALKWFITLKQVDVRRPYDRYDMQKPALASFIGTINNDGSGFLVDTTGNRRFLVVTLQHIDWSYTRIPIDQVWAQAVWYWRNDESATLTKDEKQYQRTLNQDYEAEATYMPMLLRYFTIDRDDSAWMSSYDIMTILQQRERLSGPPRSQSMELSRACKALGLEKRRINGVHGYCGIKPKDQITLTMPVKQGVNS